MISQDMKLTKIIITIIESKMLKINSGDKP
jgi:hypothetical protein